MYEKLVARLRFKAGFEDFPDSICDEAADAIEARDKAADEWETRAQIWRKNWKGLQNRMPHWIPVTERLPSPMRAVLVYAPYRHNIFMAYLQGEKWYVWGPDEYCCQRWPEYHAITHWMPLPPDPEPPKEEE